MGGVRKENVNVRSGEMVISVGVGMSGARWAVRALLVEKSVKGGEGWILGGRPGLTILCRSRWL